MHVCTGDARDCACLSWRSLERNKRADPQTGPWICEIPADGTLQRSNQTTRGDIWAPVKITLLPDQASMSLDTSGLEGVHAVKFGWGSRAGTCCIDILANTGPAGTLHPGLLRCYDA